VGLKCRRESSDDPTIPCLVTSKMQTLTGNSEFKVLISRILSSGFDPDMLYKFKVYFRLYSNSTVIESWGVMWSSSNLGG
jgi:hypothetical protein